MKKRKVVIRPPSEPKNRGGNNLQIFVYAYLIVLVLGLIAILTKIL